MARTPNQTVLDPVDTPDILPAATDIVRAVDTHAAEITENTQALALQLGYSGSLHPDALCEGIHDGQARIHMELFAIGGRLLLLKEQSLHGEFTKRLSDLDISPRVAQQLMQVALKFSKANPNSHLERLGKTKLLEMLILDDDEIKELIEDGSARGITLDDVDRMSVSELRKRLREAKADTEAKERLIANKNERLDTLETELGRKHASPPAPDEALLTLHQELARQTQQSLAGLDAGLRSAFTRLADHHTAHGGDSGAIMAGALDQIERVTRMLREDFALGDAGEVQDFLASLQQTGV